MAFMDNNNRNDRVGERNIDMSSCNEIITPVSIEFLHENDMKFINENVDTVNLESVSNHPEPINPFLQDQDQQQQYADTEMLMSYVNGNDDNSNNNNNNNNITITGDCCSPPVSDFNENNYYHIYYPSPVNNNNNSNDQIPIVSTSSFTNYDSICSTPIYEPTTTDVINHRDDLSSVQQQQHIFKYKILNTKKMRKKREHNPDFINRLFYHYVLDVDNAEQKQKIIKAIESSHPNTGRTTVIDKHDFQIVATTHDLPDFFTTTDRSGYVMVIDSNKKLLKGFLKNQKIPSKDSFPRLCLIGRDYVRDLNSTTVDNLLLVDMNRLTGRLFESYKIRTNLDWVIAFSKYEGLVEKIESNLNMLQSRNSPIVEALSQILGEFYFTEKLQNNIRQIYKNFPLDYMNQKKIDFYTTNLAMANYKIQLIDDKIVFVYGDASLTRSFVKTKCGVVNFITGEDLKFFWDMGDARFNYFCRHFKWLLLLQRDKHVKLECIGDYFLPFDYKDEKIYVDGKLVKTVVEKNFECRPGSIYALLITIQVANSTDVTVDFLGHPIEVISDKLPFNNINNNNENDTYM